MRRLGFLLSNQALFLMIAVTLVLLGIGVYLGYMSALQMREIIKEDFNQQQLILARHTARLLEQDINFLKRELGILNLSPAIQYLEELTWANRMRITLSSVREEGVVEIRRINASGTRAYLVDERGIEHIITGAFDDETHFKWAKEPKHQGQIYISQVLTDLPSFSGRVMTIMAIPTYEISVDEQHPTPSGAFSGVLVFYIDAHFLASKFTQEIKSGKTGYAWIMDNQGIFLAHPERDFIGKNAFIVRKERMPAISFDAINEIQREKMLTGQEGFGTYISGWHRGLAGEITKLIAYAPVRLAGERPLANDQYPTWSVAVVAPASEVEGVIHSVYQRQFLLQVIIGFFVLLGTIFMLNFRYERQFSISLQEEVERKRKELQKSEERYKALVENAADLIYTVDESGRILSLNRYAARYFAQAQGLPPSTAEQIDPQIFVGKTLAEVMSPKSADFHLEWLQEIKQTGRIRSKRHQVIIGGRERWFSTSIVGLKDETGQIFAFEIISRDVTGRKQMEDRLVNMEKLASIGTLAAGVAHEINNPIAVILGFTEILLEQTADRPEIQENLKIIEEEGLKCKKIVENLMTFARSPERVESSTDIHTTLEKMLAVIKNTLLTKKIRLETDLVPDLPQVKGDPRELQQVFINLINNAIAAMKNGGTLKVRDYLTPDGKNVAVEFTDTGCGIARENQPKIFDPFFTTKTVGEGTGLGLSMSYGIIKKLGGEITFVSYPEAEYPDSHGTTFTVLLPLATEEEKTATAAPAPVSTDQPPKEEWEQQLAAL